MTREEAKELLPIIQAWAEGKSIQFQTDSGSWSDITKNLYPCNNPSLYRVKPESNYRPFKTQEECWNEMLKHQPFGWLRIKGTDEYCNIVKIFDYSGETKISVAAGIHTLPQLFDSFIFIDCTPFGIKEE